MSGSDLEEENYKAKAGQAEWSGTDLLCFPHRARLHPHCSVLHPSPRDLSQLSSNGPAPRLPLLNGSFVEAAFRRVFLQ